MEVLKILYIYKNLDSLFLIYCLVFQLIVIVFHCGSPFKFDITKLL